MLTRRLCAVDFGADRLAVQAQRRPLRALLHLAPMRPARACQFRSASDVVKTHNLNLADRCSEHCQQTRPSFGIGKGSA
eukprot:949845-Rhodomonas_salina.1